MTIGGSNPGIWGESVRKALNSSEERDAHEHEAGVELALLDKAELRQLERSELYGETPQAPPPSRLRSILDRLVRRSA
jgi:hypothetical protein